MLSSSATRSSTRALSNPLAVNGSANTSNTGSRGSRDDDRVLEDHLQVATQRPPAAPVQRRDVVAEHLDGTTLRGNQFQDLMQRRGLARTRLADDAERPPLFQFEADPVDGPYLADLAAEHDALGELERLRQIRDAQHHLAGAAAPSGGAVETP